MVSPTACSARPDGENVGRIPPASSLGASQSRYRAGADVERDPVALDHVPDNALAAQTVDSNSAPPETMTEVIPCPKPQANCRPASITATSWTVPPATARTATSDFPAAPVSSKSSMARSKVKA